MQVPPSFTNIWYLDTLPMSLVMSAKQSVQSGWNEYFGFGGWGLQEGGGDVGFYLSFRL